ncbi:hypothetical protein BX600DRAFT_538138 [Xylariales sp. PMI_506]|nr:hypothetical protein BX600DRAFT_538138 [Xylariales sp. PMI_506]
MKLPNALALSGFSGLVHSACIERSIASNCIMETVAASTTLSWCPCYTEFYCARLQVPLDYQNPDLGQASVPLVKYPAVDNSSYGAYQGMILLNPGGPGSSGVSEALGNAAVIQAIVGSNWDIIGFDPRGMWYSEPVANCSGSLGASSPSAVERRSAPRVTDEFYDTWIEFGIEVGVQCQELAGGETDAGPHMSTATTARDMASIVEAFAETTDGQRAAKPSGLLNYYGISYGTFLGQTFASMFPDMVGNMVLDGVVNTAGYLANEMTSSVLHLDGIIAAFFVYCHAAGPSTCSYYTGSTPKDIYDRFNASFYQLDAQKAADEGWDNATNIETALTSLKVGLLTVADEPLEWFEELPQVLLDLESALAVQNISAWIDEANALFGVTGPSGDYMPEWTLGVQCADQNNTWYNKTLEEFESQLEILKAESIFGEIWSKTELGCLGWSIAATEIFAGPFGGDTATPILFVSNTYDSVTAIENSLASAPSYEGAQVLTIDGMGHTTSATENLCAYAKIATYFQTNQLPGNDSFCALETGPFGITLNGTIQENLEQAGLVNLS